MRRFEWTAIGCTLVLAPELGAQPAADDTAAMIRAIVQVTHRGMAAQRDTPGVPRFELLVDPVPPEGGSAWGPAAGLVPEGLLALGVTVRFCDGPCKAKREGEIRLSFSEPSFDGDDRATLVVEAEGVHPREGWIPERRWWGTYSYRLERHGAEWIVVSVAPVVSG